MWSIFSPLASRLNAVNLGQGFPNFPMPQFMKEAASRSINMDFNQYSPPKGVANLRKALGNCYGPLFQRSLDVDNEVVVTAGANEGTILHG